MQELVTLLYGSFLAIELLALLITDPVMIAVTRLISLVVVGACYWLRELNTSERHSPGRALYYGQLIYFFAWLDFILYPSVTFLLMVTGGRTYSLWLYMYVVTACTVALCRLYYEHFCYGHNNTTAAAADERKRLSPEQDFHFDKNHVV